ncbi:unnamed protein product [Polarella glacialis]|uniref:Fe2OG dioxygenase domain-containing protein n=1 Tax=Polarella glacialis TaxID=89957 RepID=A0A813GUR1_POLGL|nr:unnamed protein product [Polarella glacialis]
MGKRKASDDSVEPETEAGTPESSSSDRVEQETTAGTAEGSSQCEPEAELEAVGDSDWLSLQFSKHTFFVHPATGRVCDAPDGNNIGEFDAEAGEVRLFAVDVEAEGAEALQHSEEGAAVLKSQPSLTEAYAEHGLLHLDAGEQGSAGSLLPEGLLRTVRQELEVLLAAGALSPLHSQAASTRSDRIAYLRTAEVSDQVSELMDALPCPPGCLQAVRALEGLAAALDQRLDLGLLRPRRCMVACYGPGGFYVPHRDNSFDPKSGTWLNNRSLTAILYLNEGASDASGASGAWPEERGGCLRCFLDASPEDKRGASAQKVVDIFPKGGQLVLFDSRRLLHEVRPTTQQRLALSVWFVSAEEESGQESAEEESATST